MKLAFLTYGCEACGEESPHEQTWAAARRAAKDDGWTFVQVRGQAEQHLCPNHAPDVPSPNAASRPSSGTEGDGSDG